MFISLEEQIVLLRILNEDYSIIEFVGFKEGDISLILESSRAD